MTQHTSTTLQDHEVVSHEEWIAARKALLAEEKAFTHRREDLARQRRALPWERVEKGYVFDGPDGKESLSDLFADKSQLIVYHFMFPPEDDEGCPSCSFWADHYDATLVHLDHRDVSFAVISRAPFGKIERFKQRRGTPPSSCGRTATSARSSRASLPISSSLADGRSRTSPTLAM